MRDNTTLLDDRSEDIEMNIGGMPLEIGSSFGREEKDSENSIAKNVFKVDVESEIHLIWNGKITFLEKMNGKIDRWKYWEMLIGKRESNEKTVFFKKIGRKPNVP